MIRKGAIVIICGGMLLLSGCWDRTEINDVGVVLGAAIDLKGDKQVDLSLQVFIPRSFGGGGGQTGGGGGKVAKMTLVRSGSGDNLSDAMSRLQGRLPRRIFWGHCKVILIGEEAAKAGIREHLDFLSRFPEIRERANLFVSKGNAGKILDLIPPLERSSTEVVREMSDLHFGMKVTLKDLNGMISSSSKAAAIPQIDILGKRTGEQFLEKIPYMVGTSIFKGNKMIGEINMKSTRGLMWIMNEMLITTVTVQLQDKEGFISLNPIRETTKLIPRIENGKWIMIVKIVTEGDVIQNGSRYTLNDPETIKFLEKKLKEDIVARIQLTLRQVQKEHKTDIFGFAEEFHRKYPKQWAKVKDHWEEKFPEVEVKVDLQAFIRRPGLISDPAILPPNEVITK